MSLGQYEICWEALFVMVVRDKFFQRDKYLQDKSMSPLETDQLFGLD